MRLPPKSSNVGRDQPKTGSQHFAERLSAGSLTSITAEIPIDRTAAPPDGSPCIQLPPCPSTCDYRWLRPPAQIETTAKQFHDLIPDEVVAALPEAERLAILTPQGDKRARLFLDTATGPVSTVEPGHEDLARVRCRSTLAWILYLLGPRRGCACYAALVSAVPTDELIGVCVHAQASEQTARQTEEARVTAERRLAASAGLSAYFKAVFEQRRRPPVGDLFAAFDIDHSQSDGTGLPALPHSTEPVSPPQKALSMTNPFHTHSLATTPAEVESEPATQALESDDQGPSDEDRLRDREDDDKAAQIAHDYGAVFAEGSYRDLPQWALHELSCS